MGDGRITMQLDMFETETIENLRLLIESMDKKYMRCNRAQFGKIGALEKRIETLESEIEQLKQMQCKEKKVVMIPFFDDYIQVTR
jgi:TolA-binding protein